MQPHGGPLMVETVSLRGQARAVATEVATYAATVTHWGHGRTPTNQQLRDLAESLNETWERAKLLETLLPADRPAVPA